MQLREMIDSGTGTFAQRRDFSPDRVEKTRFQVMAEVNADSALVGAALSQAYKYQGIEDMEVLRRFLKPNSSDPDVRAFRNDVLRQGVPEKILVPEAWDAEHEQVLGSGGKTQELQATQQLLEMYQLYDPSAQRQILRDATLAITDSAGRAKMLVPDQPQVSDSVHDSELAFGTLMQGIPVTPKPGLNASEVAETTIRLMAQKLQMIQQQGSIGTPMDVMGLMLAAQYAGSFIGMLQQDPESKQKARELGDALGQVSNMIKALMQQQQQAQQAAAQQNGNGQDPEAMAKVQAMMMQAQVKAENAKQSHAEKTAQRQISFEQKTKQDQQKQALDLRTKAQNAKLKIAENRAKAVIDITKARAKPAKSSSE
jgi:hypothetical protein